jgi:tRNA nucleotidyltransferase (CCA-adding enzyme)
VEKLNWKPKDEIAKAGLDMVRLLNMKNYQAFFVGGFVRDLFTKKVSDNVDIATDALPSEVEKILDAQKIHYKQIGKKFGTILALPKGLLVEITTFRREGRYSDQRHPDQVEFIRDYLDDAKRRDFTINAMYLNPVSRELFDPVGGKKDLNAKIIRFVGDPKKRIDEDPLRMLRAVRFATTLGFKLERNTFAAIKTRAKLIQGVSGERIKQELDKILLNEKRSAGILLMDSLGLLRFILPEIAGLKKVRHSSKEYHLEGDMLTHTLNVIDLLPEDLDLLYAGLFHDTGKLNISQIEIVDGHKITRHRGHQVESAKIFRNFSKKIPFSKRSKSLIDWMIIHHDDRGNFRDAKITKQIKYAIHPDFANLLELWAADSSGNLRLQKDGSIAPGKSTAVNIGKKLLKKIISSQHLIEEFASGKFIIQVTKIKPSIRVGQISEKIKIKILPVK